MCRKSRSSLERGRNIKKRQSRVNKVWHLLNLLVRFSAVESANSKCQRTQHRLTAFRCQTMTRFVAHTHRSVCPVSHSLWPALSLPFGCMIRTRFFTHTALFALSHSLRPALPLTSGCMIGPRFFTHTALSFGKQIVE
jgi:hypothetical protein